MSNNYDEYEYDDDYSGSNRTRKSSSDFLAKFGIALLIISAIIIVIMLVKGCSNSNKGKKENNNNGDNGPEIIIPFDYESNLLEAGKKYFNNNMIELPTAIGECNQVTLQTLIINGLVSSEDFKKCNSVNTYVRVCKLENQALQYTPWFACNDKLSSEEYYESTEGTLNSIIADQTYVEFLFLPQVLKSKEDQLGPVEEFWKEDIKYVSYKTLDTKTYYRYRDELFKWRVTSKLYYSTSGDKADAKNVNEYYTSAPSGKYVYFDNKTTEAYKWYTTTSYKEYATTSKGEKAFSDKPIGDYTLYNNGIKVTMHKTRSVKGDRYATKYYACSTSTTSSYIVFQTTSCPSDHNPSYKVNRGTFYSCADPTSSSDTIYPDYKKYLNGQGLKSTDKCTAYSDWSTPINGACPNNTNSNTCVQVTVTFYNWYKIVDNGDRTYYPSGSSTASGEKVYYTSAPKAGAIKDQATKTTAYKWYMQNTTTTSNYTAIAPGGYVNVEQTGISKWSDWSKWSKSNPKISDGRNRQIESRVKIKLQEIKQTASTDWENVGIDYMSQDSLIKVFQNQGFNVSTLEDINNNGNIRYQVKMLVRNKREVR